MGCGGLYDGQMLNCCFIPWLSYKSFGAAVNKLFRHTSLLLASYLKVTLMGVLLYQILTSNISSITCLPYTRSQRADLTVNFEYVKL